MFEFPCSSFLSWFRLWLLISNLFWFLDWILFLLSFNKNITHSFNLRMVNEWQVIFHLSVLISITLCNYGFICTTLFFNRCFIFCPSLQDSGLGFVDKYVSLCPIVIIIIIVLQGTYGTLPYCNGIWHLVSWDKRRSNKVLDTLERYCNECDNELKKNPA